MDWLLSILTRPEVSLAISVVGLAATLIGVVLTVRSRQRRELRWGVVRLGIIDEQTRRIAPELQASYEGTPIASLSRARIAVWNAGTEVIKLDDIAAADPIRVRLPNESAWLSGGIIALSRVAMSPSISPDPTSGEPGFLTFDFMNPGDGIVVEIFHRGSATDRVEVSGTLKGGELREVPLERPRRSTHLHRGAMSDRLSLLVLVIGILTIAAIYGFLTLVMLATGLNIGAMATMIIAVVFLVFGWRLLSSDTKRWLPGELYAVYEAAPRP